MAENKVPDHLVRRFESIGEYVTHCSKVANPDMSSHSLGYGADPWEGTKSWEEAVRFCREGWDTVRPKVDAALEPLRERLADVLDTAPVRIHDMIGSEPDIDRFLAGEIECMWDDFHVETPRNGKVFTVLISDAVNSHVEASTLLRRGTAILALVEAFQILGYDLELWIETSVQQVASVPGAPKVYSSLVRIHRAGDPLDINSVMFPLANPSWLRRFLFASMEGENMAFKQAFSVGLGYGRAADLRCADIVEPSFVLSKGGERFDKAMDRDPVAWVLATLEAQGVYTPNGEKQ